MPNSTVRKEMLYLNYVALPVMWALTRLLEKSSYLTLVQPLGVPLSLHYFADLSKFRFLSTGQRKLEFAGFGTEKLIRN